MKVDGEVKGWWWGVKGWWWGVKGWWWGGEGLEGR